LRRRVVDGRISLGMRLAVLRCLIAIGAGALLVCGCGAAAHPRTLHAAFPKRVRAVIPAVSQTPGAGICPRAAGRLVAMYVGDGTPEPRCLQVGLDQRLEVIDKDLAGRSDPTVTVTWPPFVPEKLAPGQTIVFGENFGSYLAAGDHGLGLSRYHGGGAEIWLVQSAKRT
jgi:hypothetical protein